MKKTKNGVTNEEPRKSTSCHKIRPTWSILCEYSFSFAMNVQTTVVFAWVHVWRLPILCTVRKWWSTDSSPRVKSIQPELYQVLDKFLVQLMCWSLDPDAAWTYTDDSAVQHVSEFEMLNSILVGFFYSAQPMLVNVMRYPVVWYFNFLNQQFVIPRANDAMNFKFSYFYLIGVRTVHNSSVWFPKISISRFLKGIFKFTAMIRKPLILIQLA